SPWLSRSLSPAPARLTLSLHDALPISCLGDLSRWFLPCGHLVRSGLQASPTRPEVSDDGRSVRAPPEIRRSARGVCGLSEHARIDRKSTRLNSSHVKTSYAVFCLHKKT